MARTGNEVGRYGSHQAEHFAIFLSRCGRFATAQGSKSAIGGAWESGERAADAVVKSFGKKTG
jgi:hypothetical protein